MGKWTTSSFLREQCTKLAPPLEADLTNKTVLVTGANTGIGLEAARSFAKLHPKKLIIACRNEEKGRAAVACEPICVPGISNYAHERIAIEKDTGCRAELVLLDLGDFSSVIRCADKLKNQPLDILVENAGVSLQTYKTTKDGWEQT